MEDFLAIADANLSCAWEIIKELDIVRILAASGCTANLVGSMSTGLLMSNLDIDFHVYSGSSDIMESFQTIGKIARKKGIKKVSYFNFMEEDDRSLDWHLHYFDKDNRQWQIDIIQLMSDSPYVGKAEAVAAKINSAMTAALRKTILRLKWGSRSGKNRISRH